MNDLLWTITGHGLQFAPKPAKGKHPKAKGISTKELQIVAKMRGKGMSWIAIARRLNRDPSSLRRRYHGEREELKRPEAVRWMR